MAQKLYSEKHVRELDMNDEVVEAKKSGRTYYKFTQVIRGVVFSRIETAEGDTYKVTDKTLKKVYRDDSNITANEDIDFSCAVDAKGDRLLVAEGEETTIRVYDLEDWDGYLKEVSYKSSYRSESVFQYATKDSIVEDITGMEIKDTEGDMEDITKVVDQAVLQKL